MHKIYRESVSFLFPLNGIYTYTTLQKEVLKGSEYANATMKTIQLKIIKTAAWVQEMKTKIKIELPQFCSTREEQTIAYQRLMVLRN